MTHSNTKTKMCLCQHQFLNSRRTMFRSNFLTVSSLPPRTNKKLCTVLKYMYLGSCKEIHTLKGKSDVLSPFNPPDWIQQYINEQYVPKNKVKVKNRIKHPTSQENGIGLKSDLYIKFSHAHNKSTIISFFLLMSIFNTSIKYKCLLYRYNYPQLFY